MIEITTVLGARAFLTEAGLRATVVRHLDPALEKAAIAMGNACRGETPVVTGFLRASWEKGVPFWAGESKRAIDVGPEAIYARWVNVRSKKNSRYVQRGAQRGRAAARAEVRLGAEQLGGRLLR